MTIRDGDGRVGGGLQLESLRRRNASAVLRAIRIHGAISRSKIATGVGLSPTAVTKITAELLRANCISEVRLPASSPREPGRPRIPVQLDRVERRFIGVHIGLQRVTVGLVDLAGEVVALRAHAHTNTDPTAVLAKARQLVAALLEQQGTPRRSILGYGGCAGGWVSPDDGIVREFPGLGWRDVAMRDGLRLDGLPEPTVESSVRALALAEARLGAAEGVNNVLYLFAGNVIGCAHVLDGQIARGRQSAAGAIDHLVTSGRRGVPCSCGRRDCLWAVASDVAVTTTAVADGLAAEGCQVDGIIELGRGDTPLAPRARRLLAQRARSVGTAVGVLLDLYDPDVVVVAGGVRQAVEYFPQLIAAAQQRAVQHHDQTPIVPASLVGPSSLVRGAAAPALDAFYDDPLPALSGQPA